MSSLTTAIRISRLPPTLPAIVCTAIAEWPGCRLRALCARKAAAFSRYSPSSPASSPGRAPVVSAFAKMSMKSCLSDAVRLAVSVSMKLCSSSPTLGFPGSRLGHCGADMDPWAERHKGRTI
jgi:hypothetical protein